jgi:hypothetical protein
MLSKKFRSNRSAELMPNMYLTDDQRKTLSHWAMSLT